MIGTTPYVPLIGACDYLNCLGDAIVGWLQLRMAIEATKKFFDSATNEKEKASIVARLKGPSSSLIALQACNSQTGKSEER